MIGKLWAGVAVAVLMAIPAIAPGQDMPAFLDDGYFDVMNVLPPAPIKDEPRGIADRAIFKLTRQLKGTPRWDLAINDVATDTGSMMRDFSCAAALNLTPQNAPRTAALLERASRDTQREASAVKDFYRRQRPFQIDAGETCEPAAGIRGYDYPSEQAARGWTWGLILSEIMHERAATLLSRARAFGESRIVCGTHNASAVEAGRMTAETTLNVVRTEQAYTSAVIAARNEIALLRKASTPAAASVCSAEEILVEQPILR
jgi:acid phosphatase (class A)